jgi:hypothetical protein
LDARIINHLSDVGVDALRLNQPAHVSIAADSPIQDLEGVPRLGHYHFPPGRSIAWAFGSDFYGRKGGHQ